MAGPLPQPCTTTMYHAMTRSSTHTPGDAACRSWSPLAYDASWFSSKVAELPATSLTASLCFAGMYKVTPLEVVTHVRPEADQARESLKNQTDRWKEVIEYVRFFAKTRVPAPIPLAACHCYMHTAACPGPMPDTALTKEGLP